MEAIKIEREFAAPRQAVWRAWTDPEIIKKWWGPEGFTSPSAKVDLRVGGKYIYCMHGPKGSEWDRDMYSAGVYKEIVPDERMTVTDYFSDAEGNKIAPQQEGMTPDMPDEMEVYVKFEDAGSNKTRLIIEYPVKSEEQRKAIIKGGMQEGWKTSLDKLAKVVEHK